MRNVHLIVTEPLLWLAEQVKYNWSLVFAAMPGTVLEMISVFNSTSLVGSNAVLTDTWKSLLIRRLYISQRIGYIIIYYTPRSGPGY